MPSWLMSAIRTAVQSGWAWLAAWAATHLGVTLPADAPPWLQAAVAVVVVALVTAVIRWLETRPVSSWWGRRARQLARLAMLGIVRQPAGYTTGGLHGRATPASSPP